MPLFVLKIKKNWFTNTEVAEKNWDEIADNITASDGRIQNNLKQIGLDINGEGYEFNNNGRATQTSAIIARLNNLDLSTTTVGTNNLSLDLSATNIVKLVSANGDALSSTNVGVAAFNSTENIGRVKSINISTGLSITLTGAHWGFGTKGDFTDVFLWIYLIHLSDGTVVMGVSPEGGREVIAAADTTTSATSVNAIEKVFVNASVGGDSNCIQIGWIKADFDDTGNLGGEDFWTIKAAVGDINMGNHKSYGDMSLRF